ncbi:MAG TPA: CHAT domain-containing protein [Propionibacteriaceae bacterium]
MLAQLDVLDLLTPPTMAGRLTHLRAEGLDDETGLTWLLDRTEELVHEAPSLAVELSTLADEAAGVDLPVLRARARYQRARIAAERGELTPALQLIAEARSLWHGAGDAVSALRTDLGRMQVLDDLGRHIDALEVGEALLVEVSTAAYADDPHAQRIRAHATDNVGAAYGFLGQHARALEAYAEAEQLYRAQGMDDVAARPLANRAVELLALGRPREALVDLQAAVVGFSAAGDRLFAAKCQGDTAMAHQQLGELMESLTLLEPARRTLDELGAHAEADRLQLALAETYLAVGMLPEARAAAQASAERTGRAGMTHDQARARFIVALTHLSAGDGRRAEDELRLAAEAFRRVADPQYLARTRLAQAEAAALGGRRDDAAMLAAQAATALEAGGWLMPLTWAYLQLAAWASDPDQAQGYCDRAEALVSDLRLPALTYAWALRAARLHRAQGRVAQAETLLRRAVADSDQASAALPDYALRAAFRSDRFAAHDDLVDLLLEAGEVTQACAVADDEKARTLRDLMSDTVGPGPQLSGRDAETSTAYADLNATYLAIHQTQDGPTLALLRAQADQLEQRVSSLRLRAAAAPEAAESLTGQVQSPSPDAADALAYHVLGNDVVVFMRSQGQVTSRRLLGVVPALTELLEELAAQWSRFAVGRVFAARQQAMMLAATRHTLTQIYDVLIRPVGDFVDQRAGETLVIVPHRVIGSVPFQALYDGSRYLLERSPVVIVSTLSYAEPGPAAIGDRSALVVAAPDAAAPAVAAEGEQVAALLARRVGRAPVRLLSGERASVAAVTAALPGTGLIHLACHAVYRPGNPLFSRLRLDDGWLTSAEILQLDLDGALVTLSACESGRHGQAVEAVGLSWAFLAAGAMGVVVSQWTVHDATTCDLMVLFYRHLLSGQGPAEALRQAQLTVAEEQPHPYFWAPFTYLASPSPVRTVPGSSP